MTMRQVFPYEQYYTASKKEKIDLVMINRSNSTPVSGLEVKLTTLPDNTTKDLPDADYGSEIVVRSPTILFVACSICACYDSPKGKTRLHNILNTIGEETQKLKDAMALFHSAGYGLTYMVLNAALRGVPQRRKRLVMIGKLNAENDFIKATLLENLSDHEMSVAEYFGDKLPIQYYYRHPRSYVRRGIFSTSEPSATIRGVNRPMPKGYKLHLATQSIRLKEFVR